LKSILFSALSSLALLGAILPASVGAATDSLPEGTVTMARLHGDASAIWDASDELAALIAKKTSNEQILVTLEADATRVLVNRAQTLRDPVDTFKVFVIYARTGAISPTYQVATFAGLERLLSVKAAMPGARNGQGWSDLVRAGKPPKDLDIEVTGSLPPGT